MAIRKIPVSRRSNALGKSVTTDCTLYRAQPRRSVMPFPGPGGPGAVTGLRGAGVLPRATAAGRRCHKKPTRCRWGLAVGVLSPVALAAEARPPRAAASLRSPRAGRRAAGAACREPEKLSFTARPAPGCNLAGWGLRRR